MMFFKNMKVGFKFILPMLIILISFMIFNIIYYPYKQKNYIREQANNKIENVARMTALSIEIALESDNFEGIQKIFEWVKKDKTLSFIILATNNLEGNLSYPKDVKIDLKKFVSHKADSVFEENNRLNYVAPLKLDDQPFNRLLIGYSLEQTNEEILNNQEITSIINISIGVILCFIVYLVTRTILKPLNATTHMLKDISEGEGDLTKRLPVRGKDEIAEMSSNFNKFIDTLHAMIVQIKSAGLKSIDISQKLSANIKETFWATNQISENADSIKSKTSDLSAIVEKSASTTESMTSSIETVRKVIDDQWHAVNQSSSSIETMASNMNDIAQIAEEKKESVEKMTEKIIHTREQITDVVKNMTHIREKSGVMLDIVEMISKIAEQTNLLAMNASIEAAHAGNYGMGFRVVASEIKKLSEQTNLNAGRMTKHINESLKEIDLSADQGQAILNEFIDLASEIESTATAMVDIINMVKDLSGKGSQVLDVLKKLVQITEDVKASGNTMKDMAINTDDIISQLVGIKSDTEDSISDIVRGIQKVSDATEEVVNMVVTNQENIEQINSSLANFKTEANRQLESP